MKTNKANSAPEQSAAQIRPKTSSNDVSHQTEETLGCRLRANRESFSSQNVKVMPSPSEGDGGLQGQLPNDENDSTHSGMGIGHPRLALPLGSSDLDSAWGLLNRVFNFQLRPTAFGRLKWYISKTGNPPSLRSLPSFLIYLPEIEMAQEEMGMSLSELQNHYHQLALALRNHAKSDLMVEVRKQLDKTLHQALLLISPSSPDMDAYIASLQTSANVLRQYVTDRKFISRSVHSW